jgi:hypothetical protein
MYAADKKSLRWQLLGVVAAVYGLSFFLPAISIPVQMGETTIEGRVIDPGGKRLSPLRLSGAGAFAMAVEHGIGRPMTAAGVAWFANPLVWLGGVLVALRRNLPAGSAGLAAFVLMLVTYLVNLRAQEPATYLVGYWIWVSSAILLGIVGIGLRLRDRALDSNYGLTPQ